MMILLCVAHTRPFGRRVHVALGMVIAATIRCCTVALAGQVAWHEAGAADYRNVGVAP
jgi:hypothetical protein